MFGLFQRSLLRIEVAATAAEIEATLTQPDRLNAWLWPPLPSQELPALQVEAEFTRSLGVVPIHHRVAHRGHQDLRLILSGAVDGYHEWAWGDGWLQSRLEGVSLLPLNLVQTLTLLRLRQILTPSPVADDQTAIE